MKSKKEWLEEALERGIKVLIYQGKLSLMQSKYSTNVFWLPAERESYFETQQMALLRSADIVLNFICSTRLL